MLAFLQKGLIPRIPLEDWTKSFVNYVESNFRGAFDVLRDGIKLFVNTFESILTAPPELLMVAILAAIALFVSGWGVAIFTVAGFLLIISLGLWSSAMLTLALVLASAVVALVLGVPL